MSKAECAYCGDMVILSGSPKLGQKVICQHCGEKLMVIGLDPLELDFEYYEDEEEYDEYDDYEYDYDN